MIAKLPYGRGSVPCDFRGLSVVDLRPAVPKVQAPEEIIQNAVQKPMGSLPLAELARGREGAVVLVPDITRKAALPLVLPLLLQELGKAKVPAEGITILVACGTHPPAREELLRQHLGPLPFGVRVVQHQATDEANLILVGTLRDGTPVRLNRLAVAAPLLVSVFSVQHHYFAGFGGGPKMVFPGVAGLPETQRNHSRVIDLSVEPPRLHPKCQPGVLAGNPVFAEIAEVAKLRPVDWGVGLVLDGLGRPVWAAVGNPNLVWEEAVARVRVWFEVEAGPFHRMVVAAGGFPTDATLIQAHKALEAGSRFLVEGGAMLFVAEIAEGSGSPAMEPFLENPDPRLLGENLRRHYVQYGHTTWRIVDKTHRFRIFLYSRLSQDLARRLGFMPVDHPQAVLDRWREEGKEQVVGCMVSGLVYPQDTVMEEDADVRS